MENKTNNTFFNGAPLPSGWVVKELGEIVDKKRPISYGIVQTGENVENGIKCIRVTDIVNGRINDSNLITTSQKISDGYKRTILKNGDLVLALRGKIGEVAIIENNLVGANLTRGVALIALAENYNREFIKQQISSENSIKNFERSLNGSALQEISIGTLRQISILLPPLPEQKAIAQVLSTIDKAIQLTTQLIAQKEQRKKGLMQNLLSGKKRLKGFEGEWKECSLSDTANFLNGRAYKQEELLQDGKYRVLRVGNFFNNSNWYYSDLELEEDKYVNDGDLMYAWSASFGPRFWEGEKTIYHYHIWKLVLCENIDKYFFYYFLLFDTEKIFNNRQGGTMFHVTKGDMEKRKILLPPLAEQTAIAQILQTADKEIELLKKKADLLRGYKKGAMQQLLTGRKRLNIKDL